MGIRWYQLDEQDWTSYLHSLPQPKITYFLDFYILKPSQGSLDMEVS